MLLNLVATFIAPLVAASVTTALPFAFLGLASHTAERLEDNGGAWDAPWRRTPSRAYVGRHRLSSLQRAV